LTGRPTADPTGEAADKLLTEAERKARP
jgi:hypothetical protein